MAGWKGRHTTHLDATKPGVTAFDEKNKPIRGVTRVVATDKAIRDAQSSKSSARVTN